MIKPQVSAALVTRGDVEMTPILDSLAAAGIDDIVVWDNSERENLRTYGRYAAFKEVEHEIVYIQDDDHVLHAIPELLVAYEPGVVVCNCCDAWALRWDCTDNSFTGKGAIMDRELAQPAFDRYLERWPADELFYLWPDQIVTTLNPCKRIDLNDQTEELPWGYAPNRMNARPNFQAEKHIVVNRARTVRDGR